jgi:hypothetical protein
MHVYRCKHLATLSRGTGPLTEVVQRICSALEARHRIELKDITLHIREGYLLIQLVRVGHSSRSTIASNPIEQSTGILAKRSRGVQERLLRISSLPS